MGRQSRIATPDQRLICHARDRGRTHPNCLEPGYRSEVHHLPGLVKRRQSDADTLFFACGSHHGRVSRGELHTSVTTAGRLSWTDGTGLPQVNRAHHPDELLRNDPDLPEDQAR